jgi:UPF0716 protein FxsA
MGRLLLLFIALPAAELALLIEIGQRIGTPLTLGLIVLTGVAGAGLARSQGLRVLADVQTRLARGEMPADSLVDGLMILIASALLVTPGVLTDVFGFLCLIPAFRAVVKRQAMRRFERAVRENRLNVRIHPSPDFGSQTRSADPDPSRRRPVIDVTPPTQE